MKSSTKSEDSPQLPCPHSFGSINKNDEHLRSLQAHFDKLLQDELHVNCATPSYVIRLTQEARSAHPTKECVLFTHNLMSPGRVDHLHSPDDHYRHNRVWRGPSRRPGSGASSSSSNSTGNTGSTAGASSTRGIQLRYYHPNSTHHYLTATDVKDCSGTSVDVRLGRPTRTTLLRARYRVNSASGTESANRWRLRHQQEHGATEDSDTSVPVSESLPLELSKVVPLNGESLRAYLIGARYTSANYIDRRAIDKFGVYMPRSNPAKLFTKSEMRKSSAPKSPPSSPFEAWSTVPSTSLTTTPTDHPSPGPAYDDQELPVSASAGPDESEGPEESHPGDMDEVVSEVSVSFRAPYSPQGSPDFAKSNHEEVASPQLRPPSSVASGKRVTFALTTDLQAPTPPSTVPRSSQSHSRPSSLPRVVGMSLKGIGGQSQLAASVVSGPQAARQQAHARSKISAADREHVRRRRMQSVEEQLQLRQVLTVSQCREVATPVTTGHHRFLHDHTSPHHPYPTPRHPEELDPVIIIADYQMKEQQGPGSTVPKTLTSDHPQL